MMIRLEPFGPPDFDLFISWINSKELLVQIAGTYFSYPLTPAQLEDYLHLKTSLAFNVVDNLSGTIIGHSEIIKFDDSIYKLDKILIGDSQKRGKGIGRQLISILLTFCFENLGADTVELYVYDWNEGAIKTYQRAGFIINHLKQMHTHLDGKTWTAVQMTVEREHWRKNQGEY